MELKRYDEIGILIIDSPQRNAIDYAFVLEALKLVDEAEQDSSIRALVVSSTVPRIFCPGLNPRAAMALSHDEMFRFIESLVLLFRKNFGFPKPYIAAINGSAIGGGCLFVMGADYRLMAKGKFQIGLREIDLGMPMPIGVIAMLTYTMGARDAERVVYSGQNFTPEEALGVGLVDELVAPETLMEKALERAIFYGKKPSAAFRKNKEYFRKATLEWMEMKAPLHNGEWVECWFSKECQGIMAKMMEQLAQT